VYTQIGCNTEVYVDNVVIKTQKEERLISNLAETFDNLSKFKIKMNPKKVSAITKMKPPESLHDVQKLMGFMAALSRFIL
jgi:hypothetical protein